MMMMQKPSRLTKALLETADDMRRAGIMNAAEHEKIARRHLSEQPEPGAAPITGEEIRLLRKRAHLSQAVFTRHLNLTTGYVSQLERGAKRATGPVLALLNIFAVGAWRRSCDRLVSPSGRTGPKIPKSAHLVVDGGPGTAL